MRLSPKIASLRYIVLAAALFSTTFADRSLADDNTATLKEAAAEMKAGEFQAALELYLDAIDNDSDDWRPYQGAGNAYRKMGNDERALEYYQKALDIKGEDADLEKKIEEMESAMEETDEEESDGLKPIRGGEKSNMAVAMKNRPQKVSAAGSFILFGYGMGITANGKMKKTEKEAFNSYSMDDDPSFSSFPVGFSGDLQFAYVGKKDSKVGFRTLFSYGIATFFNEYSLYYDYDSSTDIDVEEDLDYDFMFLGMKVGGDLLYRVGKNTFVFAGVAYNSVSMRLKMSEYYASYDYNFPGSYIYEFSYDAQVDAKGSGIGPRAGVLLLAPLKNKFTVALELGYEFGSATKFRGTISGDSTGDVAVGIHDDYGIVLASGSDVPSGADELKVSNGGFWMRFGFGINFGRPPAEAK